MSLQYRSAASTAASRQPGQPDTAGSVPARTTSSSVTPGDRRCRRGRDVPNAGRSRRASVNMSGTSGGRSSCRQRWRAIAADRVTGNTGRAPTRGRSTSSSSGPGHRATRRLSAAGAAGNTTSGRAHAAGADTDATAPTSPSQRHHPGAAPWRRWPSPTSPTRPAPSARRSPASPLTASGGTSPYTFGPTGDPAAGRLTIADDRCGLRHADHARHLQRRHHGDRLSDADRRRRTPRPSPSRSTRLRLRSPRSRTSRAAPAPPRSTATRVITEGVVTARYPDRRLQRLLPPDPRTRTPPPRRVRRDLRVRPPTFDDSTLRSVTRSR